MVYRVNPSSLRSLPRPKSSRVHCSTPRRSDTRQGNVTCSPTVAIWSNGSRRNDCLVAADADAAARESKRSGNMVVASSASASPPSKMVKRDHLFAVRSFGRSLPPPPPLLPSSPPHVLTHSSFVSHFHFATSSAVHQFFPEVTSGFNPRTNFPLEKIRPAYAYARDVIWFVSLACILYRTACPRPPSVERWRRWRGVEEEDRVG